MLRWLAVVLVACGGSSPVLAPPLAPPPPKLLVGDHGVDVRIRADVPPSGPVQSVSIEQRKVMMSYRR